MAKISNNDVITYIAAVILVISAIGLSYYVYNKNSSLNENKAYVKAVVSEFRSGSKMKYYVDYVFYVKGKSFKGNSYYNRRKNSLSVGDTILVMYDTSNPENNKPYYDYYK